MLADRINAFVCFSQLCSVRCSHFIKQYTCLCKLPLCKHPLPVLGCVLLSPCDSVALSRQMQASVSEKKEHHVEICCSCIRKFPKRCRKKFSTEVAKPIYRNIRKNMKTLELFFKKKIFLLEWRKSEGIFQINPGRPDWVYLPTSKVL